MKKLNLNAVRIDGETQARVSLNEGTVAEYAECLDALPPVVVFFDGADNWLADGFHRFHAYRKAGKASIPADVRTGTQRDAILYSFGANRAHGLRMTNADKRKAVGAMLSDAEWSQWSDRKIAEACGVSNTFVSNLRKPTEVATVATPAPNSRVNVDTTKAEKVSTVDTPKAEKVITVIAPEPPAQRSESLKSSAPQAVEADEQGDFDPLTELEAAHAEITKLSEEIKAAEADDLKAEAIKWRRAYDHAQRQQSEAMDRAKQATDREAWTMKQLRRCGKAVGVDDPKKIAAAVEAMARERAAA